MDPQELARNAARAINRRAYDEEDLLSHAQLLNIILRETHLVELCEAHAKIQSLEKQLAKLKEMTFP